MSSFTHVTVRVRSFSLVGRVGFSNEVNKRGMAEESGGAVITAAITQQEIQSNAGRCDRSEPNHCSDGTAFSCVCTAATLTLRTSVAVQEQVLSFPHRKRRFDHVVWIFCFTDTYVKTSGSVLARIWRYDTCRAIYFCSEHQVTDIGTEGSTFGKDNDPTSNNFRRCH